MLPFLLARLRAKNHASEEREAIKKKDIASALLNILLKCQFISMEERHVGVHRRAQEITFNETRGIKVHFDVEG